MESSQGASAATQGYVRATTILGNRLVYYDRGTGPALILLHGMFGDHLDWEPVLEPLSQTHRVIAVDLPGFGDSDKRKIECTFDLFVQTVAKLMDELQIERATIAGNSFGGGIATLLADRWPERVKALVLVSAGGILVFSEEQLKGFDEKFKAANLRLLTPQLHELFFSRVLHNRGNAWRRYLARQNAKLTRWDYAAYTEVLEHCGALGARLDVREQLGRMELPVLFLWGDHDAVFPPEKAREALPKMKNSRLELVREAGHAPQLDNPQEFVERVETFLASL